MQFMAWNVAAFKGYRYHKLSAVTIFIEDVYAKVLPASQLMKTSSECAQLFVPQSL